MPTSERGPWPLLLSKLRQSDPARVNYDELLVAFDSAPPELLVRERVLEYGSKEAYSPPDCEHGCIPDLDFAGRAAEGLVGVACPHEEPCWRGRRWVPEREVLSFRCHGDGLFAALRDRNGLAPLHRAPGGGFTAVGVLKRRGLEVPVVWTRPRRDFQQAVLGLRQQLGGKGLIVLVPRLPPVSFGPRDGIAVIELLEGQDGHLELTRGLDLLDPRYRENAAQREAADAEVDWVHLRFATTPERHVLIVNGHDFVGFRKADAVFARLLYLAAERRFGTRGGWKNKASLIGDFTPQPGPESTKKADRALETLRQELVSDDVPGLTHAEQDAILKAERGSGRVRCAVAPENIVFDESLADLTWKVHATTVSKAGTTKLSKKQAEGVDDAQLLLAAARRLGVPGSVEDVKPAPLKKRPATRSGP